MDCTTKASVLKIVENQEKLWSCPGPHSFQPAINERKYRCHICGGEIDVANYYWYYTGLTHGRTAKQTSIPQESSQTTPHQSD